MKEKAPTLKDMALKLGISISTVSRALRGMPEISPETREAVLKLSKDLDYHPPQPITAQVTQKSSFIGVIVPQLDNFHISVIEGMNHAALLAGYTLKVSQSNNSYVNEVSNVHKLLQANTLGIIAGISNDTQSVEHFKKLSALNKPLVLINNDCPKLECPKVLIDNSHAVSISINHLLEKGYRRIVYMAENPHMVSSKYHKFHGFKESLTFSKFDIDESLLHFGNWTFENAYTKAKEILKLQNTKPDAFFTDNDTAAAGIYKAIVEFGYNMPKDIGLLSMYDNQTFEILNPSISTIKIPAYELGKLAIKTFVEQLEVESFVAKPIELLNTKLLVRDTTNISKRFFGI